MRPEDVAAGLAGLLGGLLAWPPLAALLRNLPEGPAGVLLAAVALVSWRLVAGVVDLLVVEAVRARRGRGAGTDGRRGASTPSPPTGAPRNLHPQPGSEGEPCPPGTTSSAP